MKCPTLRLLAPLVVLLSLGSALAEVNLVVQDLRFNPGNVDPLTYPDQVLFTLGNYGPQANCDVQLDFILSRNSTAGDADDFQLASFVQSTCLDAFQGVPVTLTTSERRLLTLPPEAVGEYYVFLRATPLSDWESDFNDNVTVATNQLVVMSPAPIYAVFANSSVVTSNMVIIPFGPGFQYNSFYGNSWRFIQDGTGFSGSFTAPLAGTYALRVRHGTSSALGCPNNGYAPVNISINGTNLVANYDVATIHNSFWFENDTWLIQASQGDNTFEWIAGDLCTAYWLQSIQVFPTTQPPRVHAFHRDAAGQVSFEIIGQSGRTNVIEFAEDLKSWVPLTNLINLTGTLMWTNSSSPPERGFYRVLELAP